MIRHAIVASVAGLVTAASFTVGCQRVPLSSANAAVGADTVRGIIAVVGTSFEQHLIVRASDRVIQLVASSSDSASLSRLAGVETVIVGEKVDPDSIRVLNFLAVSVDGAPVMDGMLGNDAGGTFIMTSSGKHVIANPPSSLHDLTGARIWIGGPLATGPYTYGIIIPATT